MQTTFMTNILLAVIAALLLVLVIQNGSNSSRSSVSISSGSYHDESNGGAVSSEAVHPSLKENAAPMAQTMVYQALVGFPEGCDRNRTLAECTSAAAEVVKKDIDNLAAGGKGPRQIFDAVIEKYGMEALTAQAQSIRRMRTGK
ncbi:MAG: hypothetical protein COV44_03055 [Deltaproteobacteria bacterium CG11_big_fil_rev_8_21_14_0_20_45_16]|nr:MAG: hypothetical protein COV44_03055 [Deltaproteobacteria bacterium CG11_big_fil_rev_8_21_14_0_20_45_16]